MKRWAALAVVLVVVAAVVVSGVGCSEKKQAFKFELYCYTNPRPYNPAGDKLAEAVQAELKKVGIEAEIKTLPWKEYLQATRADKKGDALFLGWIGDNGDPDNFLYSLLHSSQIESYMNTGGYKNEEFDRLLTEAQRERDNNKRYELYKKAQEILVKDAPWVFISHMMDFAAHRKNITGYKLHPTGSVWLYQVDKTGVPAPKTLIYARGADSVSLDPAMIQDGESAKVVENIYDTLVRYKEGTTDVQPWLAEDWEVSPDGLVWTFHLRKGIKFHDGTPFNAEAVKFSIERQMPPNDISEMPYADFTFGMVSKVEAVDDYTVRITLKNPCAPFLANLAMGLAAPIVSPAAVKKYGKDFGSHPVGTGPFIFERWDKDQQIVLRANKEYWAGAPKVDTVVFKVTKENSVRANELIKGDVDMIDGIDPADVKRLESDPNVTLLKAPGMNINYLVFRCDRPPFDNPKLREAVSRAINREAVVKALYQDMAIVANGPLPPILFGYVPDLKPYPYDPEGAKKILKELGYAVPK